MEYKKEIISKILYIIIDLKARALESLKNNNYIEAKKFIDKIFELSEEKKALETEVKK